jgi:hypothetical protein
LPSTSAKSGGIWFSPEGGLAGRIRLAGLLLQDAGSGYDLADVRDVTHLEFDDVAAPQLAIDGQIK